MTISLKIPFQWSELQVYRELLIVLVRRHLKVRYRGSFLGVYWSLLNPLLKTALYAMIFGGEFIKYYDNSATKYIFSSFTGLVVILFYTISTSQALTSLVANGSLLNKIKLPMSIFPISIIVANFFQFCVGTLPLLFLVTLTHTLNPLNLLCLLIPIISLMLVSVGAAFLLSALYVFFRDLQNFYELVCFAAWTSSPVFYPLEIVPERFRSILYINPLLPIMESIRQISLSGEIPDFMLMGQCLLSAIIIVTIGWSVFRNWQDQFMDLL